MTILLRLRSAVRRFLGLEDMPSLTMFQAMEKKQKERHDELTAAVQSLAVLLQASHVTRPQIQFEYQDFDSAQIAAMIDLQRNPEREH